MSLSLVGVKVGMTRLFEDSGVSIPVTVISVQPNRVMAIKTVADNGYSAIQVTTGAIKPQKLNKAQKGGFISADVEAGYKLCEFRLLAEEINAIENFQVGFSYSVEVLKDIKYVDVKGVTKGKGFQGGVKRHNFSMQDATHGNSLSHRSNGSIGQNQTPGRVFKGKKMSGQMGNVNQTTQNLTLCRIDEEKQCLFIKGAVPGATGSYVKVSSGIKKTS